MTKANQVVFDGLKTLAQRERDVFKSTVDDYTTVSSDVLTGTSVQERATKQVDGAGHIYASSVARFLELSDIAVKTNVSAADILNARVTEMFDEFRALFAGRGAPASATSAGPSITAEPNAVVEDVAVIENAVAAVPSTATGAPSAEDDVPLRPHQRRQHGPLRLRRRGQDVLQRAARTPDLAQIG